MLVFRFKRLDTVETETPAFFATSLIVDMAAVKAFRQRTRRDRGRFSLVSGCHSAFSPRLLVHDRYADYNLKFPAVKLNITCFIKYLVYRYTEPIYIHYRHLPGDRLFVRDFPAREDLSRIEGAK